MERQPRCLELRGIAGIKRGEKFRIGDISNGMSVGIAPDRPAVGSERNRVEHGQARARSHPTEVDRASRNFTVAHSDSPPSVTPTTAHSPAANSITVSCLIFAQKYTTIQYTPVMRAC